MISFTTRTVDLETLRKTIEERLCELGQLVPNQFPMTQRDVVRDGKNCGIWFCVHGPRSVKLTAICDFKKNTVIYYGSDGIRKQSDQMVVRHLSKAAA